MCPRRWRFLDQYRPCVGRESFEPVFWFQGYWQMTADEDHGPLGEMMEFRDDGTYVWHDRSCRPMPPLPFHVHNGDIYVTNVIRGKGPVAVIFHPDADHRRLSFTSPRTKNNAYYAHLQGNPCAP